MSTIKQQYLEALEEQAEEVEYCDRDYVTSGGDEEYRRGEV